MTSAVTPSAIPAAALDQLRGLHLPGGAAGELRGEVVVALAAGFCAALLVGLARSLYGRARGSVRRAALADLAGSRGLEAPERLLAQARLLRRLDRTLGGDAAAAARGSEWAARLDAMLRTDFFTAGAGRVLVDGLYRRGAPDLDLLDAELARLIRRLRT